MIQLQSRPNRVNHETFEETKRRCMPLNRIPSLQKIVNQFLSGRPIDANLDRHLEFNDFERMPVYKKGFDLIDATKIAKQNGATIKELNEEVERAIEAKKAAAQPSRNTDEEPPQNLNQ